MVIWWLFANVPRMLGENVLLTRFEYQRFNGTTKVDTIHIVYILCLGLGLQVLYSVTNCTGNIIGRFTNITSNRTRLQCSRYKQYKH